MHGGGGTRHRRVRARTSLCTALSMVQDFCVGPVRAKTSTRCDALVLEYVTGMLGRPWARSQAPPTWAQSFGTDHKTGRNVLPSGRVF